MKKAKSRTPSFPQPDRGKDLLTAREVAHKSGLGTNAVFQLLREGGIPSIQVGKKYFVPRTQYERWLAEVSGATAGPTERRPQVRKKKLRLIQKKGA